MNTCENRDRSVAAPEAVERLRRYLAENGHCRVDLIPTRNRVSMISVVFVRHGHARIRLHEQFLAAPPAVYEAMATYLRTRRREVWSVVADFARQIRVPAPTAGSRPVRRLATQGRVYDLREIAARVNAEFFGGQVQCEVGWGIRRTPKRRRVSYRSIRYGSWNAATRVVRINPLLDDGRVPREFIAYIIFHEMLHAVVPGENRRGRRYDHGAAFRKREGEFPGIESMRKTSRDLLDVLRS